MKQALKIVTLTVLLSFLVFFSGCKKTADVIGEYQVVVTLNAGVTGTLEAGTYYHNLGDQISYSYSIKESYSNLVVKIDGEEVATAGTLTVAGDHTLDARATPEYTILGSWTMTETYTDTRTFTVTITFVGTEASGTVSDSDGGGGTFNVDLTNVSFTLVFPNATYEYGGYFDGVNEMSGSCKRISASNEELAGGWAAERVTVTSTQTAPRPVRKKN